MSTLDSLIQAARQMEANLDSERAKIASERKELEARASKQTNELKQYKQYAQALLARDTELRRYVESVRKQLTDKLQASTERCTQLEQANAKLSTALGQKDRAVAVEIHTLKTSYQQAQIRLRDLQAMLAKLQPELAHSRGEAERAQAALLERDHRYQSTAMGYQVRERELNEVNETLREQMRRLQNELTHVKARWAESERQRQESEKLRANTEQHLRRQAPALNRLQELEQSHQSLEKRIHIERRQRQQADTAFETASQEKEMLLSKLRLAQDRLDRAETELSKAASEAALLRAARKSNVNREVPPPRNFAPRFDPEMIERLALPGYPVRD